MLISLLFVVIGVAGVVFRRALAAGHAAFERERIENERSYDANAVRRLAESYGRIGAIVAIVSAIALITQLAAS